MGFFTKTLTNLHIITIILLLLHSSPVFPQSNTSRLDQDQVLRDGGTLVSPQQIFELGFFSPGNSSSRYVGIWYYGIQNRTVVWVANRDNPIPDNSGVFGIGNRSLILSDRNGQVYWSSDSSAARSDLNLSNLTVMLVDSGNLILSTVENAGREESAIWRSCDHPTDTFLPNLRVYLNITEGISQQFLSWRTANDPAKGNYSMGIDPRGSPQVVVWDDRSNRRLWQSGHWNNQIFIGVPRMRSLLLFGFRLVNVDDGLMYFTFENPNSGPLMRFLIKWNGAVQQMIYNRTISRWTPMVSLPSNGCEKYNKCGDFGICRPSNSPSQLCSCMRGFDPNPRFQDQRNSGNWSGGCVRRTGLECSANGSTSDGFVERMGVKLPDFADRMAGDRGECEYGCLQNCSCMAYAFVEGIGCLIWGDELVDVEEFEQGGETLSIRVADSDLVSGSNGGVSKTTVIAVSVTCAVVIGVLALLLWRYRNKVKVIKIRNQNQEISPASPPHSPMTNQSMLGKTRNEAAPVKEELWNDHPELVSAMIREKWDVAGLLLAWKLWKEGKPEELIDPLILDSCNRTEALQCIHVAMLCVQSSAVQRPTMSSVVFMLEGENTSLPQPNELDLTSLSSAEMDLIMEGREINVSSNDVTITEVSGR